MHSQVGGGFEVSRVVVGADIVDLTRSKMCPLFVFSIVRVGATRVQDT